VLAFGVFAMLASGAAGGFLGWQNRDRLVHVRIAEQVWTSPLWALLLLGAVLACWFLLGASCIHLRIRERRERRAAATAVAATAVVSPAVASSAGARPPDSPPTQRRTRTGVRAAGLPS
jgi:hypothetical protein